MLQKGKNSGKNTGKIEEMIRKGGFDPIRISNGPGYLYPPHSHPETKLLVILSGSMEVSAGGKEFSLKQGDKLIIPGNVTHSAEVGEMGCTFFWSEKER